MHYVDWFINYEIIFLKGPCQVAKQAGAELSQAQSQLGLRLANVVI